MPSHACGRREAGGKRHAGAEAAGEELCRGGRANHQREDEQHADDLGRLGDGERDHRHEEHRRPGRSDTPLASASSGWRLAKRRGRLIEGERSERHHAESDAATASMPGETASTLPKRSARRLQGVHSGLRLRKSRPKPSDSEQHDADGDVAPAEPLAEEPHRDPGGDREDDHAERAARRRSAPRRSRR